MGSDDCLNKLQTIESDGFVVPQAPPPQPPGKTKKQSFCKLDTNWTCGTTTVITPTQSENLSILDPPKKTFFEDSVQQPQPTRGLKPKRPLTLNVNAQVPVTTSVEGVVIETPSKFLTSLGFDTLMTSTGLTPTTNLVTPVTFSNTTCPSQQRNSDSIIPDLNIPQAENISLVSL